MASEGRESLPVQAVNQIIDLIVKEVLSCIETTRIRTGNESIGIGRDVNDSTVINARDSAINITPNQLANANREVLA